jgi:hypothetical protein
VFDYSEEVRNNHGKNIIIIKMASLSNFKAKKEEEALIRR